LTSASERTQTAASRVTYKVILNLLLCQSLNITDGTTGARGSPAGDQDTSPVRAHDARFSGPTIDPMSREVSYDPQTAAIVGAYVGAFNDYVRKTLKFGEGMTYKLFQPLWQQPELFMHQPPGASSKQPQAVNVMPDLAFAMQQNPNLKVQMHGGYYDLATPFFAAAYELEQLPMQASLQKNIEMHFYESGHMIYAHEPSLKALHANVAAFVEDTRAAR
jgi:carboxypeptidase C (cathepsin A)